MQKEIKICTEIVTLPSTTLVLEKQKKWNPGQTIRIRFLDGIPQVQKKVEKYAKEWEKYANIKFSFGDDPEAEVRISFKGAGSWSYLGTDCLSIEKHEPTMNYGWLHPSTPDTEFSGAVLHEFGHVLGCVHEHQNPNENIPWDKEAVYKYYMNPPINWSKEQIVKIIFEHYSKDSTNFSEFDKDSIMLFAIPNQLTIGDFEVRPNNVLSERDKDFIQQLYPF